jgi:hypothetical protein
MGLNDERLPQWPNFASSRQGAVISPGRSRRAFEGACEGEPYEPLKRQGKQLRARPEPARGNHCVDPGRLAPATTAARRSPFSGGLRS